MTYVKFLNVFNTPNFQNWESCIFC